MSVKSLHPCPVQGSTFRSSLPTFVMLTLTKYATASLAAVVAVVWHALATRCVFPARFHPCRLP